MIQKTSEPLVAIQKSSYNNLDIKIKNIFKLLDYTPKKNKILIKPNFVARPQLLPLGKIPKSVITDIRFIEALIRVFDGYEIIIGESAVTEKEFDRVIKAIKIEKVLKKYSNVKLVNLEKTERFHVNTKKDGQIQLPTLLKTHEYINVPKLKTHILTGVSIGCKNQKGLLLKKNKIKFHKSKELHANIEELTNLIKPDLTIVDGIVALHNPGPIFGKSKRTKLIIAGKDVMAVDVACCDLFSISLNEVPHLKRIPYEIIGNEFENHETKLKATIGKQAVGNIHSYVHNTMCTRCVQSLIDSAVSLWGSPWCFIRSLWNCVINRTNLVCGNHPSLPDMPQGRLVCWGDCTKKLAEKHNGIFVKGCPPTIEEGFKLY